MGGRARRRRGAMGGRPGQRRCALGSTAGEAWNRAALSYHFAKFVWMVDLDRYRETTALAVDALRNAHRQLDPSAERLEIPLADRLAAMRAERRRGQDRRWRH